MIIVPSTIYLFFVSYLLVTCVRAMLWAGIVFGGVHLSVCTKSKTTDQKLINLVRICPMVSWKLVVTFDLDIWPWELCKYTSSTVSSFKCLNPATSFSAWRYIFRISRSPSSFKVTWLISRSQVCAPLGHRLIVSVFSIQDDVVWLVGWNVGFQTYIGLVQVVGDWDSFYFLLFLCLCPHVDERGIMQLVCAVGDPGRTSVGILSPGFGKVLCRLRLVTHWCCTFCCRLCACVLIESANFTNFQVVLNQIICFVKQSGEKYNKISKITDIQLSPVLYRYIEKSIYKAPILRYR